VKSAATRALNKKHAGTAKHLSKAKHKPTAHKKAAAAHKQAARRTALTAKAAHARALSIGDVSCCTATALARSLRLSGWPVDDADVLALYKLTADSPDAGASILATLDAAYVFGLAGVRPVSFQLAVPGELEDSRFANLLLGLELPEGPHTVLACTSGDVWSWGDVYSLGDEAVIEEAWEVTWP
jgi:hypothetical protein